MASESPAPSRHELTSEERARGASAGGKARAERIRERRRTFEERLSARMDEEIEKLVGVFIDALEAEISLTDKDGAIVATVPAHGTRIRAAMAAIHEAYGKPSQRVEITGDDGDPVEIEHRGVKLADLFRFARDTGAASDLDDEDWASIFGNPATETPSQP